MRTRCGRSDFGKRQTGLCACRGGTLGFPPRDVQRLSIERRGPRCPSGSGFIVGGRVLPPAKSGRLRGGAGGGGEGILVRTLKAGNAAREGYA